MCDEGAEQDEVWRLLTSELSVNFTNGEIEAQKDEIKNCIRGLMERGDLEELAPKPEVVSYDFLAAKPPEPSTKIKLPAA